MITLAGDAGGDRVGKQIVHSHGAAGAQVEDAAPGRMPGVGPWQRDVYVILEREKWSVHGEKLELGGGFGGRVFGPVFVGIERTVRGMRARVLAGKPRYDAILEYQRRVAPHEIATVDTLSNEERVLIRSVVVREEDLVIASSDQRYGEGSPTEAYAGVAAPHPEGGVLCRDEELGRRRGTGLRRPASRRATTGEKEQRTQADGTKHRGKYTA